MQLYVKGKGLHVTDALRAYAQEKIGHLQHYFDHIIDAHVTMRTERNSQIIDVTLHLRHFIIKAEERSPDMYASIDLVRDHLEQQIRKYKTRKIGRHHRANGKLQAAAVEAAAEAAAEARSGEADEGPRIVRSKRFAVKPMHAEEAAHQMELLGHDFFVFVNAETEQLNVLYKRKSGDLGLIEPTR
jgi:putative sigma-54 modulation protein